MRHTCNINRLGVSVCSASGSRVSTWNPCSQSAQAAPCNQVQVPGVHVRETHFIPKPELLWSGAVRKLQLKPQAVLRWHVKPSSRTQPQVNLNVAPRKCCPLLPSWGDFIVQSTASCESTPMKCFRTLAANCSTLPPLCQCARKRRVATLFSILVHLCHACQF